MKRVFVTGASSLLGTNLIISLLKQGYAVRALVRNPARYQGPQHPELVLVQGSLGDDLSGFLVNCDFVVHAAAETGQNLLKYSGYRKTNFSATVRLFEASAKCGIKKFIYISSANTLGYGSLSRPGNENNGIMQPFSLSFYAQSKAESEKYLLCNKHKMDIIIINPTFMLGAWDMKPSSGKLILMGWNKKIIFYPPGGKNCVHVADVADGIILSFEKGVSGEKYLLANENLSYEEFFEKMNRICGQKPVMIRIPASVLGAVGYFGDLMRFLRIRTSLSSVNMRMLCVNNFYTNHKSVSSLGATYRSIDSAIRDAIAYFENVRKNQTKRA